VEKEVEKREMAAVFARWVAGVVVLLMMRPVWAQERPPKTLPTKSFTYKVTKQTDLVIFVHYPLGWREIHKRAAIVFFIGGG
jgi:hypothetical protein